MPAARNQHCPAPARHRRLRRVVVIASAAVSIAASLLVLFWDGCARSLAHRDAPTATYVGTETCASCHAGVTARWRGSHHDLAMRAPNDSTVAGDFANARYRYAGVTTTFSRRDGQFVVNTDGPDGVLRDYPVRYTLGTAPLQQYLIALGGGRLQALGVAWDTRPRADGGQRWFHLYPNQRIAHGDELHWTGIRQNWNYMCAECHSTGVEKSYDPATRSFATTFAAPNVGCEACHGPGSLHASSRGKVAFAPLTRANEVERCARCHSRREEFSEDYVHGRPLGDTHRVAMLDDQLYHADGQIEDEVFEYGSFVQSRMYARGVVCSDCHEPHAATLRAPGSQVCVRCHLPAAYQSSQHHFHQPGSKGADCVGCHMPTRTYMVIHERHDHSIRVPRPDLSVSLGVPNACTSCHADRSASWAARQVKAWYGHVPRGYQRYAEAFAASTRDDSGATRLLIGIAGDSGEPAIARASALQRLASRLDPSFNGAFDVIRAGLSDSSALVRRAAVLSLAEADASVRVRMLSPLLGDNVRAVRVEAARALASVASIPLDEYLAGERFNADRPESHVKLALLYASRRQYVDAERELREALTIDPRSVPALVNLADVYRATDRDADAGRVLRSAVTIDPTSAAAHHALALYFVRAKRGDEALSELARAARLAPDVARYANVYAIALGAANRRAEARAVLIGVLSRHPFDRDALSLLISRLLEHGDTTSAIEYVRRLAAIEPSNMSMRILAGRLSERHSYEARRP